MLWVTESLQGDDLPAEDISDRHHTSTDAVTVDEYGTGPAFAQSTSELGAVQRKIVAQRIEQHSAWRNVELVQTTVDVEANGCRCAHGSRLYAMGRLDLFRAALTDDELRGHTRRGGPLVSKTFPSWNPPYMACTTVR